jgi:GNAT superfamily N-acetyltransferase
MEDLYRIINARPDDVSAIGQIELAAATLLKGYAPEEILQETTGEQDLQRAQAEGRLWVALAGETPIGFAHVEVFDPISVHLEEIDVHPDHGRRGVGTKLVTTVCRWAWKRGYRAVTLTTFRDVPWNMPFYSRLGFEEIPKQLLTPDLRSILRNEGRRGLDSSRRVAMKWMVPFI